MAVDPDRQTLRGDGDYHFSFPQNMEMNIPLAMSHVFEYIGSDLNGTFLEIRNRRDPEFHLHWEGWPGEPRPEGTFLTHVTQDHLVFGPLFLWFPAPYDTNFTTSGLISITCPERAPRALPRDSRGVPLFHHSACFGFAQHRLRRNTKPK